MGRDKAFIEIDGAPLWQRQLRMLEQLAPNEIFLAGPPRPEWQDAGFTIICDAQENAGPLGGVVAALRQCSTDFLLALAVDLPKMTVDYLRELIDAREDGKGVVPMRDRYEPLVALYPTGSLKIAEQLIAGGDYSLHELVRRCLAAGLLIKQPVRWSDVACFLNMNTPSDLAALAG